ncbi:late embryogenesis abundant protein D-34-like [Coffea eugenioides]|uniref:late embryogenesis abundant protein D-34-like n=1 Tax=Coffea eugenioides TaxID=49369 RepID=UPI000F610909|nr:late embryogenesis abundant protein D-34-like [Coffea eugenioides]
MSQDQPRRPQGGDQHYGIKYGDVFDVKEDLASKNNAPRDAAAMQAAENRVLGQTPRGGPASVMQSAADVNQSLGVVGHDDITDITRDQGVNVAESAADGRRVIAEAVGGQVVGGYATRGGGAAAGGRAGQGQDISSSPAIVAGGGITIGEALEATALTSGNKPVDMSDAAAIQAAEVKATGRGQVMPGGIGAEAQAAADLNPGIWRDEDKTKLGDVLGDATDRLPDDKTVTREDAKRVVAAEVRNDPNASPHPGGVAASTAAAARLNQKAGST